jgi:hypothetical protein
MGQIEPCGVTANVPYKRELRKASLAHARSAFPSPKIETESTVWIVCPGNPCGLSHTFIPSTYSEMGSGANERSESELRFTALFYMEH